MEVNLAIEQIRQAEAVRREAMLAANVGKLRAMTSDDYTHIESNGRSRNLEQSWMDSRIESIDSSHLSWIGV